MVVEGVRRSTTDMLLTAATFSEFAGFFPCGSEHLFGVLTAPPNETIEGSVHGFTTLAIQEAVIARIMAWVRHLNVITSERTGA